VDLPIQVLIIKQCFITILFKLIPDLGADLSGGDNGGGGRVLVPGNVRIWPHGGAVGGRGEAGATRRLQGGGGQQRGEGVCDHLGETE
jgi:hypothetical protein